MMSTPPMSVADSVPTRGRSFRIDIPRSRAQGTPIPHQAAQFRRFKDLDQGGEASEDPQENDDGKEDIPFRLPQRPAELGKRKRGPLRAGEDPCPHRPPVHEQDEEDAREKPADEHPVDRAPPDHRVQNHRPAGGEQQTERPRRGQETDGKPFGVALHQQGREEDPSQGEDRDARCPGERGEKTADHHRRDGDGAGHPPHHRAEQAYEAL